MFIVSMIQSFKGTTYVFSKKALRLCYSFSNKICLLSGKPVMIVIEYMENGALDAFLRVSTKKKTYINMF